MSYVDGFVIPVPKKNMPGLSPHGRISWPQNLDEIRAPPVRPECVGDSLDIKWALPFPRGIKTKPGETVCFSFIMYKSRAHRDRVNHRGHEGSGNEQDAQKNAVRHQTHALRRFQNHCVVQIEICHGSRHSFQPTSVSSPMSKASFHLKHRIPVTISRVLDVLESRYPNLTGTLRDHTTKKRRPMIRFYALNEDLSHESTRRPPPRKNRQRPGTLLHHRRHRRWLIPGVRLELPAGVPPW